MYDAIIVGARCAGSPTAMLLARRGYRVLLVDRATFPSNSMRNHVIRHTGVVHLHQWGLLDRLVATGCPPMRKVVSNLGDFPLTEHMLPADGVDAEYGPRRIVLDNLLVEAAAEAGAEVRQGFSVSEILVEDGRVVGIGGSSKDGSGSRSNVTERAAIVIGADGQHSLVAKTVGAPAYDERPTLTVGYYSYWSDMPCDALEVWMLPRPAFLLAFPTNFGQTCVAVQAPVSEFPTFRADIEGTFMRYMELDPSLAERVRAGRREEQFYGTADLPNRFRKPYGPGWALVGDAGYVKDPINARGISDAFHSADLLSEAIDAGLSGRTPLLDALAQYEQQRNTASIEEYEENYAQASFHPIPPQVYQARARMRQAQEE
jgi:flavin-dependent dehydrogenase